MKEEALELADFIEKHMVEFGLILGEVSRDHIVGTIRKLVAELDKQTYRADLLENRLRVITGKELDKQGEPVFEESNEQVVNAFYKQFPEMKPQTKPLSIEEIEGAFYKKCWYYDEDEKFDYYGFAREIEERHGIK